MTARDDPAPGEAPRASDEVEARRALWCALARLHCLDADPPAAPPSELAARCRAAGLDRAAARVVWLIDVSPVARVSLFERVFGPPPWAADVYAEVDEAALIARIEARRARWLGRRGPLQRLLGRWWALPVRAAWRRVERELA